MDIFNLITPYTPSGDQPRAIAELIEGIRSGASCQTLLGVTGSGKTFTMANVIREFDRPVLVISHNKTLAAQLYSEFQTFFPENAVEYFVSYYDYYQPEAYIPQRDVYIEKDASINSEIEKLRLSATSSLLSRRDVIVVASVSCIYGLGSPDEFRNMLIRVRTGEEIDRDVFLRQLVSIQYERNDIELTRGKFRARGDVVELVPAYDDYGIRVEFFGDQIETITLFDVLTGQRRQTVSETVVYPAKHFVMPEDKIKRAVSLVLEELDTRLNELQSQGKILEAQRLESRTRYDMEMLQEIGYCQGIENYSLHLSGRMPGDKPYCLIDYFPRDFITLIDESHATIPQIRGMYNGDRSRKMTLVEHGFRLPSALDNRPLDFSEFEEITGQCVFMSATPSAYERENSKGRIVEQIIRPTGLIDPEIEVRPATGQVDDLIRDLRERTAGGQRVLVTTLTKKTAEDLSEYLKEEQIPSRYLHSEIDTIERVEILKSLRSGDYYVLVGVNLLREGLDLPEVTTVYILDADREGFLRSDTSILQTMGRAARNSAGKVILYADTITGSLGRSIDETERRRCIQVNHNRVNNITPQTIRSEIKGGILDIIRPRQDSKVAEETLPWGDKESLLRELKAEMRKAAEDLRFEDAALIRDRIYKLLA